jgi:hypothetical protein
LQTVLLRMQERTDAALTNRVARCLQLLGQAGRTLTGPPQRRFGIASRRRLH